MNTQSPRILMLLENSTYPGDVRVRHEAETLTGAGYHVTVIAPALKGQPLREVRNGVSLYRYRPRPSPGGAIGFVIEYGYAMLVTFILAIQVLFKQGFDVIHAHSPPDTFVLIAALFKLLGKRFVFDHHDLAPEMYNAVFGPKSRPSIYRMLLAFEKLSCRLADRVIATNESYRAVEIERDRVPAARITIVRNGPELANLPTIDSCADSDSGKHIIGYMGVIGFQDGVDHLVHALRHLRDRRSDFVGVIVGDGEAIPSLKALAEELKLDGALRFAGWQEREDLARHLAAMEICAAPEPSNPYTDRSTMLKVMDYMAWGKPVVAFDLPEHRFTAGDAAIFVRGNDDCAFADALAELMDDPARRVELGRRARARVEGQLAWEYCAPNLLEAYRKVLDK